MVTLVPVGHHARDDAHSHECSLVGIVVQVHLPRSDAPSSRSCQSDTTRVMTPIHTSAASQGSSCTWTFHGVIAGSLLSSRSGITRVKTSLHKNACPDSKTSSSPRPVCSSARRTLRMTPVGQALASGPLHSRNLPQRSHAAHAAVRSMRANARALWIVADRDPVSTWGFDRGDHRRLRQHHQGWS